MKLVSILSMLGAAMAGEPIVGEHSYMSHAELRIKPGHQIATELKEFLDSGVENDVRLTQHVTVKEVEGVGNPSLVFVGEDGEDKETLFAEYVPVGMVKDLIRDKKWAADKPKNEEL